MFNRTAVGKYNKLHIETMNISFTDENDETIISMPSNRQEKNGVVTSSRVSADYILGFRGLIGKFTMDDSNTGSIASGSVNADF